MALNIFITLTFLYYLLDLSSTYDYVKNNVNTVYQTNTKVQNKRLNFKCHARNAFDWIKESERRRNAHKCFHLVNIVRYRYKKTFCFFTHRLQFFYTMLPCSMVHLMTILNILPKYGSSEQTPYQI